MKKNAIVEVQFNWIFVLGVGVLILLFFIGITQWYRGNEERKVANEVLNSLQAILTGAQVAHDTAKPIEIPRVGLSFECDADECSSYGCASSFEFEGTGVSKDTTMDIIFTQEYIKSNFLHAWTLEWSMPYKVTNFFFLSSPAVKYYLVYKDPNKKLAEKVARRLSDNELLEFQLIEANEVRYQEYNNEYLARFVMFFFAWNNS